MLEERWPLIRLTTISTPSRGRWRLPVEDAWKPAVKANLEVSLRLARLVDEFALPDEAEPASVFAA